MSGTKIYLCSSISIILIISLLSLCDAYRPYPDPGDDLWGQYCGRRGRYSNQQCCPGRDDRCTVPILDTYCYCDIFCNRTVSDCCPDFWPLCMGIEPPPGSWNLPAPINPGIDNNCYYDGALHAEGTQIHPNCNNCTCVHVADKQEFNWKCTQKVCLIRDDLLDIVNKGSYGWEAKNYSVFWGKTLKDGITYRLGTYRPMKYTKQMNSLEMTVDEKLPKSFSAEEEWPGLIHGAMDQGDCGASWAFSTTSVAADRLSIHSDGMVKAMLSPQNLLDCDKDHMQDGCEGGHVDRAWWYIRRSGLVSEKCYPYKSGVTGKTGKCRATTKYYYPGAQITCVKQGQGNSKMFQASPPYRIASDENEIMKEIMENGPVQATMEVKEDFYMYSGGVYRYSVANGLQPPRPGSTGFHSVKIIGWGIEDVNKMPQKYWLCTNSWGTWWGEKGKFKILRGVNECKIESFVVGVWGKVNGRQIVRHKQRMLRDQARRSKADKHLHKDETMMSKKDGDNEVG